VSVLEHEKWYQRGIIAASAGGVIMIWEALKMAKQVSVF